MNDTALPDDPDSVQATETLAGPFQVEVVAGGLTLTADEPVQAGGLGSGPTPYDLLASALAACTVMTVRLYADRKGWPLQRASVRALHARAALTGKDRFAREITLEGPLSPEQHQRLLEIANRCPVHLTLERGSDIVTVLAHPPAPAPQGGSHAGHMRDMLEACED